MADEALTAHYEYTSFGRRKAHDPLSQTIYEEEGNIGEVCQSPAGLRFGLGSGKTTLIKLITRLYQPDKGRIVLDGTDLQDWKLGRLHERVGVIFQDFVRYQLKVGENIGVGDVGWFCHVPPRGIQLW